MRERVARLVEKQGAAYMQMSVSYVEASRRGNVQAVNLSFKILFWENTSSLSSKLGYGICCVFMGEFV